jgi:hypothetical protein
MFTLRKTLLKCFANLDKLLKKKELRFRKTMAASFILKTTRDKIKRFKGDT